MQFFISHLATWVPTRSFSERIFRPLGATNHANHWNTQCFATLFAFYRTWTFLLLTFFDPLSIHLLFSSLTCFSDFLLWLFPSVLVKLPASRRNFDFESSISQFTNPLASQRCLPTWQCTPSPSRCSILAHPLVQIAGLMSCLAPESESGRWSKGFHYFSAESFSHASIRFCSFACKSSQPGSIVALGLAPLSLGLMVSPLMSSWAAWKHFSA